MIEQVAQAILAKILEINSGIVGRPVEADEFAIMCAYEYASAALSALPPRELMREAMEALDRVLLDVEFMWEDGTLPNRRDDVIYVRARAAADKIRAVLNDRQ